MTPPKIGLIWAEADGGVIGRDGVMPWHLPEDLAHFKSITLNSAVVMGRRTWDSLPPRFRPLPGRRNIVVTRQPDWREADVETAHSVPDALALAAAQPTDTGFTWVIGGAQLFTALIGEANRLEVTKIRVTISGDTIAPTITKRFRRVDADPQNGWHTSKTGLEYRFLRYEPR
ncbi:dihydrofolate reductase [Salinibacterium sp. ZJ454]|uniref:dihydrofolate reductase n=1 Tax=Salinibacterium sp. ZJ454 TaxID=2708339 RepID=UPI0014212A8B|nr:dihydrofolate reductase [Salinibacterium sp. ZJ454]